MVLLDLWKTQRALTKQALLLSFSSFCLSKNNTSVSSTLCETFCAGGVDSWQLRHTQPCSQLVQLEQSEQECFPLLPFWSHCCIIKAGVYTAKTCTIQWTSSFWKLTRDVMGSAQKDTSSMVAIPLNQKKKNLRMSILKKDDMQAAGRTCMKWNLRCFYVFWWSLTRFRSTLICKGEKVKVWLWQVMYSHQAHLHCRLILRVDRKKKSSHKSLRGFFSTIPVQRSWIFQNLFEGRKKQLRLCGDTSGHIHL